MNEELDPNDHLIVKIDSVLPEELIIIPIRFRPVFPGMITPIVIPEGNLADSLSKIAKNINYIGLVLQIDDSRKGIDADNLYKIGTIAKIMKIVNLPNGGLHILLNSLHRFTVKKYKNTRSSLSATIKYKRDTEATSDKETAALTRAVLSHAKEIMAMSSFFTEEMKLTLVNVDEPGKIADFVSSILNLDKAEFQEILESFVIKKRLEKTLQFLGRERDILELQQKIEGRIHDKASNQQREYFLKEQLSEIRKELGLDGKKKEKDTDFFVNKIKALKVNGEIKEQLLDEAAKLEYTEASSSEYGVIRNYLTLAIELPWHSSAYSKIDLSKSRSILEKDHYGLEDVKERILEILAVREYKKEDRGTIICFVGPPGVGKTSLGKSIARAMSKKFYRFSLGGMRDEAEIKGHRRTYIGAMPGKILRALKIVKTSNPVLMLDEIDKLGNSFQGDPASALLEVLDPEQNDSFRDHYLDLPFDLSHITFITTANTLDTIATPLLDRMEIIHLAGYLTEEKIKIASKYLVPRVREKVGLLKKNAPSLSTKNLRFIIENYSREAGVRSLERQLEKYFRKIVKAKLEKKKVILKPTNEDLQSILGTARFRRKDVAVAKFPGTSLGLAWTQAGGSTLIIESKAILGKERFKLTGQLGKVMLESADIALTFVQARLNDEDFWQKHTIHIHVPDGATPKDGPSAGITIASSLISLYNDKKIKASFAMTGELNLSGEVLPIGGLREKILAAKRVGIKHVIFPEENLPDWQDLPDSLKKGIHAHPVSLYDEVEELLF